ncbi:hypothetical protein E4T56_gene9832 [Termitomyces sp. T112]|nr:hypothetical protein E4T56_gene9832 [Termitomyces sp. T112]
MRLHAAAKIGISKFDVQFMMIPFLEVQSHEFLKHSKANDQLMLFTGGQRGDLISIPGRHHEFGLQNRGNEFVSLLHNPYPRTNNGSVPLNHFPQNFDIVHVPNWNPLWGGFS